MSHYNTESEAGAIPETDVRTPAPTPPAEQPPLLRTHCSVGLLTITQDAIRIDRAGVFGMNAIHEVMPRANLTSVQSKSRSWGLMTTTLTFIGRGGAVLRAEMIINKDAQRAREILGYA